MVLPSCLRSVLHLDADAFFASVEQRDDPRLRGRPVAVGTGVVASCSYEARCGGVRTGMRLSEARRLCRSLLVLPGDYRRYEQAARRMLAICQDKTPLVEVAALDDMYLDLTGQSGMACVAEELHEQVRDEVGLSISLGAGSNKLVAAVATDEAKQQKLRIAGQSAIRNPQSAMVLVPPGTERAYLAPWSARVLPGVGPKVAARLDRINVHHVGEVAQMPLAVLCGLFANQGKVLREQAHGIDPRPVEPYRPPQSVSRCTSFDPPTGDLAFLRAMLDHLLERAAVWLRFHDRAARGLTVTIRYGDYESAEGRMSLRRPVNEEQQLKDAARDRFDRLYTRRLPLRLLGVALSPLTVPEAQGGLFADPDEERQRRLNACKDAIRQRFGFMAVVNGASLVLSEKLQHDRENYRLRTPCLTR
jgi:DNA polymerase-4